MSDVHWFAIYEKATGRLHTTASIDLDDPDTAIDQATGRPYSLSGMRGISHPGVTAGTHEYRKDLAAGGVKIAERRGGPIDRGFEVVELAKDPSLKPVGDPDGWQEWDETQHVMVERSGADRRQRMLQSIREQEIALEADMVTRGEAVPPRTR